MEPNKILIIEDDRTAAHLAVSRIEALGHDCVHFTDGKQALDWLQENEPDLLLLDYHLPDLDGRELLEKIQQLRPALPFIIMTGEGSERLAVEFMKRGALDYIVKDENFWPQFSKALQRGLDLAAKERGLSAGMRRLHEERFGAIFNNSAVGMVILDASGNYLQVNEAWSEILGYAQSELLKMNNLDVIHEEDRAKGRQALQGLKEGSLGHYRTDRRFVRRDGSIFWGDVSVTPMRDAQGEVESIIVIIVDVTERRETEEEIRNLAYYDVLTELPNRTLFYEHLDHAMAQAQRSVHRLALLFLDLDRFKEINDTLGHDCGDLLLRLIGRRLKNCIRSSDTLARLGGDEFVALVSPVRDDREVVVVAQKILQTMAAPFDLEGKEVFVTTSVGIVVYPVDGRDRETLMRHADLAMYAAKARGRNNFQFYSDEMNIKARERHALEEDLRRALSGGEFFLHYQPQIDLETGRIVGTEALLRWRHDSLGVLMPDRFLRVAEETGLIRPLGEWVLRTACAQKARWNSGDLETAHMSINISGHQLREPDFIDTLDRILDETGVDPRLIDLELTEKVLMESAEYTLETLTDLRVRGVRLTIDDFGTGYSSLSYLKNFPIDKIKIAQDFVRDLTNNSDNASIAETIILMARSLDLKVMAEGVESRQQLDFLRGHGCHVIQGYLLASPAPADEMKTCFPTVGGDVVPISSSRKS